MVVVGGAMSLVAAGVVLVVVTETGFVDGELLRKDLGAYVLNEPAKFFASAIGFYVLAYSLAFLASVFVYRDDRAVIEPGATGWLRAMWVDLPDAQKPPVITVELKDGRKIAGGLRSFTAAPDENREIVLARPLVATAGPKGSPVKLNEDFVVLREDQIAVVSGVYGDKRTGGQIVRFKISEAFPADDQLARWMTVCAMAFNDLLVVNALLIPRLEEKIASGPGEIFYLGRVAAAHLFEAATFLRKSDRIPAIKKFVADLGEEAQTAYNELLQIGDGGSGEFYEQLKHARNKSFHYQELFLGDNEEREPLKRAMAAHAADEQDKPDKRSEISDLPPPITGFRADFAYDIASEMLLPENTETEFPPFTAATSNHIAKFAIFTKAALNAYTVTKPAEVWEVEDSKSEEGSHS
jgi:hypothetical protein